MSEQATSTSPRPNEDRDVDYGRYYYRHDCGIPYERNDHWLDFFGKIADAIVRDLRPSSVLDAGCAMGFLVEALRARGVEAWGIDVSEYAISQVHESVREYCSVGSIAEPLPRRYDLIVSIEVLEHIPATEGGAAVATLAAATDRILLSTTPDDFAEATHLNVQPPEAWSATLAREGFLREVERDVTYVTPWAALYTRRAEPLEETVGATTAPGSAAAARRTSCATHCSPPKPSSQSVRSRKSVRRESIPSWRRSSSGATRRSSGCAIS